MARALKLEEQIAALEAVRDHPTSEAAIAQLRISLTSKHSVVIAKAAKWVSDHALEILIPELVVTFDRLMVNPVQTDQACLGKTAIADALYHLSYSDETLFLNGIHHVQNEPVWGGVQDMAVALRGICATGLVRMNYGSVMVELADLLADPEPQARVAAAQAIAYTSSHHGIPLLRLKARIGDKDPDVVAECLEGLLSLAPEESFEFVTTFLAAPEILMQEMTALVLGSSRLPQALTPLQAWWQAQRQPDLRQTALLAIFNLRNDQALTFLLSLVATGSLQDAKDAIVILSISPDPALWERVCQQVERRGDAALTAALDQVIKPKSCPNPK